MQQVVKANNNTATKWTTPYMRFFVYFSQGKHNTAEKLSFSQRVKNLAPLYRLMLAQNILAIFTKMSLQNVVSKLQTLQQKIYDARIAKLPVQKSLASFHATFNYYVVLGIGILIADTVLQYCRNKEAYASPLTHLISTLNKDVTTHVQKIVQAAYVKNLLANLQNNTPDMMEIINIANHNQKSLEDNQELINAFLKTNNLTRFDEKTLDYTEIVTVNLRNNMVVVEFTEDVKPTDKENYLESIRQIIAAENPYFKGSINYTVSSALDKDKDNVVKLQNQFSQSNSKERSQIRGYYNLTLNMIMFMIDLYIYPMMLGLPLFSGIAASIVVYAYIYKLITDKQRAAKQHSRDIQNELQTAQTPRRPSKDALHIEQPVERVINPATKAAENAKKLNELQEAIKGYDRYFKFLKKLAQRLFDIVITYYCAYQIFTAPLAGASPINIVWAAATIATGRNAFKQFLGYVDNLSNHSDFTIDTELTHNAVKELYPGWENSMLNDPSISALAFQSTLKRITLYAFTALFVTSLIYLPPTALLTTAASYIPVLSLKQWVSTGLLSWVVTSFGVARKMQGQSYINNGEYYIGMGIFCIMAITNISTIYALAKSATFYSTLSMTMSAKQWEAIGSTAWLALTAVIGAHVAPTLAPQHPVIKIALCTLLLVTNTFVLYGLYNIGLGTAFSALQISAPMLASLIPLMLFDKYLFQTIAFGLKTMMSYVAQEILTISLAPAQVIAYSSEKIPALVRSAASTAKGASTQFSSSFSGILPEGVSPTC